MHLQQPAPAFFFPFPLSLVFLLGGGGPSRRGAALLFFFLAFKTHHPLFSFSLSSSSSTNPDPPRLFVPRKKKLTSFFLSNNDNNNKTLPSLQVEVAEDATATTEEEAPKLLFAAGSSLDEDEGSGGAGGLAGGDGEGSDADEPVLPYEPRRASLASIFESEDEEVIEVDANLADESLRLENCGLRPETVAALQARGIHALFPIQKHVFEPSRAGRDLIGRARTGSGKTLAFSLPIIEGILEEKERHAAEGTQPPNPRAPRCIVLAPTRELAKQVEREMAETAPGLALGCFYGGVDIGGQIRQLRRGCDAVVGTPGRVIDLIDRGALDLSSIKFFVLDEADMMLNVGFEDDVERILESVPSERQTLLFSATMPA